MKLIIASDHAGFKLKNSIRKRLKKEGFEVDDLGAKNDVEKVDFPDYAFALGKKVVAENTRGVLVCGTGAGVCIAANKVKGVRAVLVYSEQEAADAMVHNNANVLCFNGYRTKPGKAMKMIHAWLNATFDASERRLRRLQKISDFENG